MFRRSYFLDHGLVESSRVCTENSPGRAPPGWSPADLWAVCPPGPISADTANCWSQSVDQTADDSAWSLPQSCAKGEFSSCLLCVIEMRITLENFLKSCRVYSHLRSSVSWLQWCTNYLSMVISKWSYSLKSYINWRSPVIRSLCGSCL